MTAFEDIWKHVLREFGLTEAPDRTIPFEQHFVGEVQGIPVHVEWRYDGPGNRFVSVTMPIDQSLLTLRSRRVLLTDDGAIATGDARFDGPIAVHGDMVQVVGLLDESLRDLLLIQDASFDMNYGAERVELIDYAETDRPRAVATVCAAIRSAAQVSKRLGGTADAIDGLISASERSGPAGQRAWQLIDELAHGKHPTWDSWATRVRCLKAIQNPDVGLLQDAVRYAPTPSTRIGMMERLAATWSDSKDILSFAAGYGTEQHSEVQEAIARWTTEALRKTDPTLHTVLRLTRALEGNSAADQLFGEVLGALVQAADRKVIRKTFFDAELELQRRFMSAARLLGAETFYTVCGFLLPTVGFEYRELLDDERTAALLIQWAEEIPISAVQEEALIKLLERQPSAEVANLLIDVLGKKGAHRSYLAIKRFTADWDPTVPSGWSARAVLESMAARLDFDGSLSVSGDMGGELTLDSKSGGLSKLHDPE